MTEKTRPCSVEAFAVSPRPFQGRPSRHREEEETPPAPFLATTTVAAISAAILPQLSPLSCNRNPRRRHQTSPVATTAESKQIQKAFDYRAGRRYQQIMRDLRGGELQRLKWMSETLRKQLLDRSLDRLATDAEVFRATHTRKRDRSIVEKRADDLLTEYSANLEQATQQAQEEGDESATTVDPDVVWRQTLSEPCKNRVYGAGGFFASSLCRSGYGGSSASASSTHTGPAALETCRSRSKTFRRACRLRLIDEVRTLKDTLAERDARAEEHLKRMEEMQRQMAAFYDPLRPGSSAAAGGSGSSTAPPLPPHPPPRHPAPEDGDDDDDYEDA
ncbi:hypothetical protein PIB30_068966 [Stylosanthes scabra]|uniref:Uncharacterized protein n=1 Tax=Stylosanthes scabra TaxID=79078 RepID=A0ABU6VLN1_9FABA|nr:hypothetical protein [Stylosanthes scabra]